MALLREHRGPLAADLHRYHGLVLSRLGEYGIPLRDLAAFVANFPLNSACARAVHPNRDAHSYDLVLHNLGLLRSVEHSLRWLVWAKTEDGSRGRDIPEVHYFPWEDAPERDGGYRGDPMTVEEADEFLGWADKQLSD